MPLVSGEAAPERQSHQNMVREDSTSVSQAGGAHRGGVAFVSAGLGRVDSGGVSDLRVPPASSTTNVAICVTVKCKSQVQ